MKVLVLCGDAGIPLYGPSGASAHVRGMVRAWHRRGARVRVATPLPDDPRGRWGEPLPCEAVHRPPRPWPRGLRTRGRVRDARSLYAKAIRDFEPDVVWERHSRWDTALDHPRRILEVNAPVLLEGSRSRAAARRRVRDSLRRASRVVAVSRWLTGWATDLLGSAERVVHVPNGVEPRPGGDRAAARTRLGLTGPVLGFLGSNKPAHGLLRIPRILDALGPGWTALCVGGGPVAAPHHPRLRAVGQVHGRDLPDYLAAMDVAIAPYAPDAPPWFCPLKVLEYRAAGLPVVAPDLGDCAALTEGAGVIPDSDAPEAWADAVVRAQGRGSVWVRTWDEVLDEALSGVVR